MVNLTENRKDELFEIVKKEAQTGKSMDEMMDFLPTVCKNSSEMMYASYEFGGMFAFLHPDKAQIAIILRAKALLEKDRTPEEAYKEISRDAPKEIDEWIKASEKIWQIFTGQFEKGIKKV